MRMLETRAMAQRYFVRAGFPGSARGCDTMGRCPTNHCSATSSALPPTGSRRPLADMLAASEQGAGLLSAQSYDVVSYLEQGDTSPVTLTWRATLPYSIGE